MDKNQRARLGWIKLYEEHQDAGYTCRRCGISRPTLRKWLRRYRTSGIDGLKDKSKKPHSSPTAKITSEIETLILELRCQRKLGAKRLCNELLRLHGIYISPPTIQKVLIRNNLSPLASRPKWRKNPKRYSRPIPGDRVQVDVCKIAPGLYHYSAIDDCSRYRVLGLYPRRTAANTILFLERAVEEMPFPIQRIQTDRGREFFAIKVQKWMQCYCIKFRPIKPRSPHLNGKVERSHKTDLLEFYSAEDLNDPELGARLGEWQHHYNWHRPHSSIGGIPPIDRCIELSEKTPFGDQVEEQYLQKDERIQEQNYKLDLTLRKLK